MEYGDRGQDTWRIGEAQPDGEGQERRARNQERASMLK